PNVHARDLPPPQADDHRRHHHDDPVGAENLRPGVRGHEPARRRRWRGRCPRVADVSVCVRPTSCERRSGGGRRDVPEHPHDGRDCGDAPLHGETLKLRLRSIVIHVFAWALAIAWLFPFVGLLMASFRPIPEIIGGWWNFGQFSPTLDKFGSAFSKIGTGLGNSVLIAVPGTLIPMFVATLAGYGFARFSFPVRDYLFLTIVLLMTIPQQMVAIPIFRIMLGLGLANTVSSLILLHSAWGLPWIILFMRNFISSLPKEVEEAARVDGASDFKVFFRIVLRMGPPTTRPGAGSRRHRVRRGTGLRVSRRRPQGVPEYSPALPRLATSQLGFDALRGLAHGASAPGTGTSCRRARSCPNDTRTDRSPALTKHASEARNASRGRPRTGGSRAVQFVLR